MASYDNPVTSTYTALAVDIASGGTLLSVQGPLGKQGRLVGIGAVVTTDTTVASTLVRIGDGSDTDKFGLLSVPVASAGAGFNNATISTNTLTQNASTLIAANEKVVISSNGGSTAGAADITVTIAWF